MLIYANLYANNANQTQKSISWCNFETFSLQVESVTYITSSNKETFLQDLLEIMKQEIPKKYIPSIGGVHE